MSSTSLPDALQGLPRRFRERLVRRYGEIKRNYREARWEPSELSGGKLCEVVFRVLEWHTSSPPTYTPFGTQIRDFRQACRRFESLTTFPHSVRFHIPGVLAALYDIRNKRGVGHEGGDVEPNHMDAAVVVAMADWMIAELVRIFHGLSTHDAEAAVEGIISRDIALVWEVAGRRRILNPSLSSRDRTLALLYHSYPAPVDDADLFRDTEHSNKSVYRRDVLRALHRKALIDYDEPAGMVSVSPTGLKYVEDNIRLWL